jgi:hypothetical protein
VSQHFLLSPAAKTLSLAQVFRMSDAEAEAIFCRVRWFATDGKPVCPHCGGREIFLAGAAAEPRGAARSAAIVSVEDPVLWRKRHKPCSKEAVESQVRAWTLASAAS